MSSDLRMIYSESEWSTDSNIQGGFWSNEVGWTACLSATVFTQEELSTLSLPLSVGSDARAVDINEATLLDQAQRHAIAIRQRPQG